MYYRSNEPVFQLEEREIETSTISKEGSEDVEIIQEVEGMEEQEMESSAIPMEEDIDTHPSSPLVS